MLLTRGAWLAPCTSTTLELTAQTNPLQTFPSGARHQEIVCSASPHGASQTALVAAFKASTAKTTRCLVQQGAGKVVDALDAVPEKVKVVHAVVHPLHVLEDVGPGVGRGTQGGEVARRRLGDPHETQVLIVVHVDRNCR